MYVGTLGPHDPCFVPQRFLDMYANYEVELTDDEKKDAIRHYMAFCTYEDYLFGLILEELKQHEDFADTLILYVSDHGDYNGEHGLWCKRLPGRLIRILT